MGQFEGSGEVGYGSLEIIPFMFQDDFENISGSIIEARMNNIKVDVVVKEKRLSLNEVKTVCLVMGTTSQKEEVRRELEARPMMCGSFVTKLVASDKWLGDYIHSGGLGESCLETIRQREGKVKGAALEIAVIVDDWRAQVVGGFQSGLLLWESCCIPSLLHNSGTWVELSSEGVRKLETLQLWFVRLLLRQGPGVPTASLLWETSLLTMELRVWREKLCMIVHLRELEEDSLGRRVWEEQRMFSWPGLAREAEEISRRLVVEDPNTTEMTKRGYRREVTKACHQYNEMELRQKMLNKEGEVMEKCRRIAEDSYGRKEYFGGKVPREVRSYFATRVSMLPLAGNFSHDKRFARTGWWCRCGEEREEEEHVRDACPLYQDIRDKYPSLQEDSNLVKFFDEMLSRRDDIDEVEEKRKKEEEQRRRAEEKRKRDEARRTT
jgi:hypothetical protein